MEDYMKSIDRRVKRHGITHGLLTVVMGTLLVLARGTFLKIVLIALGAYSVFFSISAVLSRKFGQFVLNAAIGVSTIIFACTHESLYLYIIGIATILRILPMLWPIMRWHDLREWPKDILHGMTHREMMFIIGGVCILLGTVVPLKWIIPACGILMIIYGAEGFYRSMKKKV